MSINTQELRMAHAILDAVFLYVACTAEGFVKVGISRVPAERLYDVHCGSPSPIKAIQWVWIGSLKAGRDLEAQIRREWKDRNSRGEWYRFDYSKPEDKREFHDTLAAVLEVAGVTAPWTRFDQRGTADLLREQADIRRERPRKKSKWNG